MALLFALVEEILDLEEIDVNLFRGQTPYKPKVNRIFGGQTIAQSLVACYRTVPNTVVVHSLHSYFLRPGNPNLPVIYKVTRVRDGRSFTTRTVAASQQGNDIFSAMVSFHTPEEGWAHQEAMPAVPAPETVPTNQQAIGRFIEEHPELPEALRSGLSASMASDIPLEFRSVNDREIESTLKSEKLPAHTQVWIKANGRLSDDTRMHQCVAAYMSDNGLMTCALRPHGESLFTGRVQCASVDHAMWFHHPFRADEFLLYVCDSPQSAHALGLNFGKFYNRAGKLVISTAQEGLMRPVKPSKAKRNKKKGLFKEEEERKESALFRAPKPKKRVDVSVPAQSIPASL